MATENGFFTNQTQFQNDPNVSQRDNLKGFYGTAVRPAYVEDLVAKAEEAAAKSYEYSQKSKQYRNEAEVIRDQTQVINDQTDQVYLDTVQVYNDTVVQANNAATSEANAAQSAADAQQSADDAANTLSEIEWKQFVRNEATLNQMREQNKSVRAASGFDHYGQGYSNNVNSFIVNEGLWSNETFSSVLRLGRGNVTAGSSKTTFPVTHIAGFISKIFGVNQVDGGIINSIKFPEAPNGTVIYDSTGNARGTGNPTLNLLTDVDPKYGDVAGDLNEAVARAFEGQAKNGDFRNGSNHWALFGGAEIPSDYLIIAGVNSYAHNSLQGVTPDRDYILEIVCDRDTVTNMDIIVYSSDSTKAANKTQRLYEGLNRIYVNSSDFNQNYGSANILRIGNVPAIIDSVVVRVATEEVVINRHDMFGAEFFLEEVSQVNPFVYPQGMVQSQATSMNGIATTTSNRPVTYYAVYDGDNGSQGRGVDFWAADDEQKKAMVSDEANNIFMLDDGRLVQWRMRQRTIAGTGNGDWYNVDPTYSTNNNRQYLLYAPGSDVNPQGIKDVVPVSDGAFPAFTSAASGQSARNETGVFDAVSAIKTPDTDSGINGECYFHVWGVVPRLNQGAYHPSFNPMGTATVETLDGSGSHTWYTAPNPVASVAECFSRSRNNGNIGSTSGRPDGKSYDAIYASGQGGVIDYRLPSWDMSSKEEASKVFQKVVNGTYRGEESLIFTKRVTAGGAGGTTSNPNGFYLSIAPNSQGGAVYIEDSVAEVGDTLRFYDNLGDLYIAVVFKKTSAVRHEILLKGKYFPYTLPSDFTNWYMVTEVNKGFSVSGEFTMVDVIGDPAEILATPALANGWLGGWIPVIPDGVNQQYPLTRKDISGNPEGQKTTNSGTSWGTDGLSGFNSTTNSNPANYFSSTVVVVNYTAFAKQTKEANNAIVLNGDAGVGDTFALMHRGAFSAPQVAESFLGKVLTGDGTNGKASQRLLLTDYEIQGVQWTGNTGNWGKLARLAHEPISLSEPVNDSPAVKALWYQTANNQQVSMNFAWNELVYNSEGIVGNEWGDTEAATTYSNAYGVIRITDGTATYTNLNGDTCLYGTAELSIPYGYTKNQARAGEQTEGVDL